MKSHWKGPRGVLVGAVVAILGLGVVLPATAAAAVSPATVVSPAAPVSPTAPVSAGATVSQPAASPNAMSDCPAGYLCAWVDGNFGRDRAQFAGDNEAWGLFSDPECVYPSGGGPFSNGTWNDCASSLYNHGNYDGVIVYRDNQYQSYSDCLPLGTSIQYMPFWPNTSETMNDEISSNKWVGSC